MRNHSFFSPLLNTSLHFLFIFFTHNLFAQPTYLKTFGDSDSTRYFLQDMTTTLDGGTLISSTGLKSGIGLFQVLTKMDCNGVVQWNKETERIFAHRHHGNLLELSNGDIVISYLKTKVNQSNHRDIGLAKFDAFGNLIWNYTYGVFGENEFPSSLTQSLDGGFLIAGGISQQLNTLYPCNFYFLKIDDSGNLLWTKTFGEENEKNEIVNTIIDQSGNYIHIANNKNTLNETGAIIKMSPTGNIIFYKEINSIYNFLKVQSITETPLGEFLLTGKYIRADSSSGAIILKVNTEGELSYINNLTSKIRTTKENGYAIVSLKNGGYALFFQAAGVPTFDYDPNTTGVLFITILNEDENYLSTSGYKFHEIYNSDMEKFFLKERLDGDFNIGYNYFEYPLNSSIHRLALGRLDENFSIGCDDIDATNEFHFVPIQNCFTEEKPYTLETHGERSENLKTFENQPFDLFATLCETELVADFTIKNICPDQPINFFDQSLGPIISQEWDFDNGAFFSDKKNPSYQFSGSGIFPIQLTVSDGCQMDTLIQEIEIPEECICEMIFPNAFTPNQDGVNDFFQPIIDCDFIIENYKLLLFNRWGQLVFESNNPDEKWDGKFRKKAVPSDVLIFKVQYEVKDEFGILIRQVNETGDVTLIR